MATNNAINGPIPWKVVQLPSLDFPYQVHMIPFHAYMTSETDSAKKPIFIAPSLFETRIRLGDQYRIMSYGTGAVGFRMDRQTSQILWYNGASGTSVTVSPSFVLATSITITCIDAPNNNIEQFMIELGTGELTLA